MELVKEQIRLRVDEEADIGAFGPCFQNSATLEFDSGSKTSDLAEQRQSFSQRVEHAFDASALDKGLKAIDAQTTFQLRGMRMMRHVNPSLIIRSSVST